jgi:hypothetical protein
VVVSVVRAVRHWLGGKPIESKGLTASGASMRPKFSMRSDYGPPAQRQWISASRRGTGSSVGPEIMNARWLRRLSDLSQRHRTSLKYHHRLGLFPETA